MCQIQQGLGRTSLRQCYIFRMHLIMGILSVFIVIGKLFVISFGQNIKQKRKSCLGMWHYIRLDDMVILEAGESINCSIIGQ